MSRTNGHRPGNPAQPQQGRIAQPPPQVPLEELQRQFESVRDDNQVRLGSLGQLGAEMDPMSFLHARMDCLIDSISRFAGPNGPRWAVITRLEFEQHISRELDTIEKEATQAQLAQGALWTPAMISRYARETGLFKRP